MPASKKDIRNKKNKALEAAGLRAPLTQSGVPVKPPKQAYVCTVCKISLTMPQQIKVHTEAKHSGKTVQECFPGAPTA
ncbi:hypothetical protein HK097_001478 [Rhizophlyctis rosea]|uniref:C2H2-type domain-containing protein n=1 Tax=Rhizophlyctis rosea TaxID=64517 RepID=A0AAD5S629_9FUNG|nr:hypothetical protein HK097_001478 [Rhizophlyctis rosea]